MATGILKCVGCGKRFRVAAEKLAKAARLPDCPRCGGALQRADKPVVQVTPHPQEQPSPYAVPLDEREAPDPTKRRRWLSRTGLVVILMVCSAGLSSWLLLLYVNQGFDRGKRGDADQPVHFSEAPVTEEERLLALLEEPSQGDGPSGGGGVASGAGAPGDPNTAAGRPPALQEDKDAVPAPPALGAVEVVGANLPERHYGWKPGRYYQYHFSVTADVSREHVFNGGCRFLVGPTWAELVSPERSQDSPQAPAADTPLIESGGSAFVVAEDGYLVTCAHVVDGAEKVVIDLGGARYNARLSVVDYERDLALVRIDASGLQPLVCGDSDGVRLGQDVRVLGYPLSDFLKGQLNVTRGAVSGRLREEDGRLVQVDAAVNPGNSGGPVVNDRGEVIGVASSGLFGQEISGVSFAVPSNEVARLLKRKRVGGAGAAGPDGLSGPDLVEHVARSVGHVLVWSKEETTESVKLTYDCALDSRALPDEGISWSQSDAAEKASCEVDRLGRFVSPPGDLRTPFLWSHPMRLFTERLDPEGRDEWTVVEERPLRIELPERSAGARISVLTPNRGRLRGGFARPRHAFGGFGDDASPTRYRATVTSKYRVVRQTPELTTVVKNSRLEAHEFDGALAFTLTGVGGFTFDRGDRVPVTGLTEFSCDWRKKGAETTFPIKFAFKRTKPSQEDIERTIRRSMKTHRRAMEEEAYSSDRANASSDELISLSLERIAEKRKNDQSIANELADLKVVAPDPARRDEVLAVLKWAIRSKRSRDARAATAALKTWTTAEDVPYLMAAAKRTSGLSRHQVLKALAELADERAIDFWIEALQADDSFSNYTAVDALTKFGPRIEDRVLPLLQSKSEDTRRLASRVLAAVGGEESVLALKEIHPHGDSFEQSMIEMHLRRIERRLAGDPIVVRRRPQQSSDPRQARRPAEDRKQVLKEIAKLKDPEAHVSVKATALKRLAGMQCVDALSEDVVEQALARLSTEEPPHITIAAIRVLGAWGDESHAGRLNAFFRHARSARAQEAFFEAFAAIGDEQSARLLAPYLEDPRCAYKVVTAFRKLGPGLEERLIGMLDDDDVYRRARAAAVLGRAGGARALAVLEERLSTEEDSLALDLTNNAVARLRIRVGSAEESDAT